MCCVSATDANIAFEEIEYSYSYSYRHFGVAFLWDDEGGAEGAALKDTASHKGAGGAGGAEGAGELIFFSR